ncbi:MAG TPA: hypothetical protein DEO49_08785 [Sutterella sp.]|jgi:hypothetical protein|nr:hypothetical protein [Sutterella sp.]
MRFSVRLFAASVSIALGLGGACAASLGGLCRVSTPAEADGCRVGDSVLFLAKDTLSHKQVLTFAATRCDPRFPIVQNLAGVACTYTDWFADRTYRGADFLARKRELMAKGYLELEKAVRKDLSWKRTEEPGRSENRAYYKVLSEGSGPELVLGQKFRVATWKYDANNRLLVTEPRITVTDLPKVLYKGMKVGSEIEFLSLPANPADSSHIKFRILEALR